MRRENPYFNSPYPTNPAFASIADGLSRALFGDPVARAEQEQQQAELDAIRARAAQAQAAAGYDIARTRGVDMENTANSGLPGFISGLFTGPEAQAPRMGAGGLLIPADPVPVTAEQRFNGNLPAVIAALVQGGNAKDLAQVVGTASAFAGGDELARRGLVAQGKTPGKDFAITPERADNIREQGYASQLARALGVAEINNRDDVPVARIAADARRYAADQSAAASRYGADVRGSTSTRNTVIKEYGTTRGERNNNAGNLRDGPFAQSQPGYVGRDSGGFAIYDSPEAGAAAQERLLANAYLAKGYNTPASIVSRYAPSNENSPASMNNYSAYIARKLGIGANDPIPSARVGELAQAMREFETGQTGTRTKTTAGSDKPTSASSKPLPMNVQTAIGKGIDDYYKSLDVEPTEKVKVGWIRYAEREYRKTGNVRAAIAAATERHAQEVAKNKAKKAKKPAASKPTVSNW